jgi:hypothetical protein
VWEFLDRCHVPNGPNLIMTAIQMQFNRRTKLGNVRSIRNLEFGGNAGGFETDVHGAVEEGREFRPEK